jgi:hypothetical protein
VLTAGVLDQRLHEDGHVVLPNTGHRLVAEWLVALQARHPITVEQVALSYGGDGLLVILEGPR